MDRDREFTEFATVEIPRLLRTARLLCGDEHLAEDLVQATLVRLYVGWPRVRRTTDPTRYAQAALIKGFRSHRRVGRNREIPVDAEQVSLPSPELQDRNPDGLGDAVAAWLDVTAALNALSSQDRAVLVLRFWLGLSVAETAAQLNITQIAVRQRSSRAAKRARQLLSTSKEATS